MPVLLFTSFTSLIRCQEREQNMTTQLNRRNQREWREGRSGAVTVSTHLNTSVRMKIWHKWELQILCSVVGGSIQILWVSCSLLMNTDLEESVQFP